MQQAADLRQRATRRSSIKAAGTLVTGQPSSVPETGSRNGETGNPSVLSQAIPGQRW